MSTLLHQDSSTMKEISSHWLWSPALPCRAAVKRAGCTNRQVTWNNKHCTMNMTDGYGGLWLNICHVCARSAFVCGAISKGSFPPFHIIPYALLEKNSWEWTEYTEQAEGGEKASFRLVRSLTKRIAAQPWSDNEGDWTVSHLYTSPAPALGNTLRSPWTLTKHFLRAQNWARHWKQRFIGYSPQLSKYLSALKTFHGICVFLWYDFF